MMWLWIGLIVAGWIGCGVLSRGLLLAYFQGKFAMIAAETYEQDLRYAGMAAVFGPIGLLATLLGGFYGYGWRWK